MAWKMIYLARRNPLLAAEQFAQAWREHSALGARCSNVRDKVRSVTQCSRILDGPMLAGATTDYDGVNLLELRDLQAATDIWSDAETLAIMRPDEPRVFSTYVREFTLVGAEDVLRDAPRSDICVIGFLRRDPGLVAADWPRRLARSRPEQWMLDGPFSACARVVHNAVCLPPPPGYEYDSICEWWFAAADDARAAFTGRALSLPIAHALGSDCDLARSVFMFTRVTHRRP